MAERFVLVDKTEQSAASCAANFRTAVALEIPRTLTERFLAHFFPSGSSTLAAKAENPMRIAATANRNPLVGRSRPQSNIL